MGQGGLITNFSTPMDMGQAVVTSSGASMPQYCTNVSSIINTPVTGISAGEGVSVQGAASGLPNLVETPYDSSARAVEVPEGYAVAANGSLVYIGTDIEHEMPPAPPGNGIEDNSSGLTGSMASLSLPMTPLHDTTG